MEESSFKQKVVFVGDVNVGKTSIVEKFMLSTFSPKNNPTIGVDY